MNQLSRRIFYFVGGLVPACIGTLYALHLGAFALLAVLGTLGLAAVTLLRFPLPPRTYGRVALLLACGLALASPFGIVFVVGTLPDVTPALLFTIWLFFGPMVCATHALWRGRCTPNNSFKGMPLRGTP